MHRAAVVLSAALVLAACASDTYVDPEPWFEPPNYSYLLTSMCGERLVIGTFWITVVDHEVVGVDARDPSAAALLEHGGFDAVPTLQDLMTEYVEARDGEADVASVEQASDGHPTSIEIDWSDEAIDDEACYTTSDYVALQDVLSTVEQANLACVDYYRHVADHYAEDSYYWSAFAGRLADLGFTQPSDDYQTLAGVAAGEPFEGAEPEMAALIADAGASLGEAGAVRCFDLAEGWGIEEYPGKPSAGEVFQRQRSIWEKLRMADYKLLVSISDGVALQQCDVDVVDGRVSTIADATSGDKVTRPPFDLPFTVDDVYASIGPGDVSSYDFVWSIPRRVVLGEVTLVLAIDPVRFPSPRESLFGESPVGCGG
jgi:hypothetical protein